MLSSHLDLKSMSMNHEGLYAVSIPKDKAQKNLVLEFIKDKASYVKKPTISFVKTWRTK